MSPVRWGADGHNLLIFSPGFMLFVLLVPVHANADFPAKRQEFKVERSAPDTEPERVHCSSVCAEQCANGDSPA
jgi:hypothetical protein